MCVRVHACVHARMCACVCVYSKYLMCTIKDENSRDYDNTGTYSYKCGCDETIKRVRDTNDLLLF